MQVKSLTLMLLLVSSPALANGFTLAREDHRMHYAASTLGTFGLAMVYRSTKVQYPVGLAAVTMLALGALKELTDNDWDGTDMEANAAGVFTGAVLNVAVFEF